MKIYSIMDNGIERFMQPFFSHANAGAIRAFRDHVNEKGTPANMHPEDYSLYFLADFNEETGELEPNVQKLALAIDLKDETPVETIRRAK